MAWLPPVPVGVLHRPPVEVQPDDVVEPLGAGRPGADRVAGEEAAAAERRVLAAQLDEGGGELDQRLVDLVPVHPAQLAVLGVGVVVALLGAAELVAVQQHRRALAEQQRGQEVALGPRAQRQDLRVVGRSLDAVVGRAVVALAVVVVLAVGLVVLLVVGHEVAQREAVVRGDEVDLGDRAAPGVLVEVGRARPPARRTRRATARRARSRGRCRGRRRSTRSTAAGSRRPGSRRGRCPTARRSASPG